MTTSSSARDLEQALCDWQARLSAPGRAMLKAPPAWARTCATVNPGASGDTTGTRNSGRVARKASTGHATG